MPKTDSKPKAAANIAPGDNRQKPYRNPWFVVPFAVTAVLGMVVLRACGKGPDDDDGVNRSAPIHSAEAMQRGNSLAGRNGAAAAKAPAAKTAADSGAENVSPKPRSVLCTMVYPTTVDLARPDAKNFVPTNPEHPESALFGSVRTGSDGRARFHKGVDIAPQKKDRKGRALDSVYAVAAGRVAYVNRVAGDSNYGIHVVLLHSDPIGDVYTLYAHLASVADGLKVGQTVEPGTVLGVMGNTANSAIPLWRSHLHFEVGLVHSSRFGAWCDENGVKPNRGNFHGWNMHPVNPLTFFPHFARHATTTFGEYLATVPAGVELVVANPKNRIPEYFGRYPSLWNGPVAWSGPIVLSVSDSGLILGGRPANEAECETLAQSKARAAILAVHENILGRNGVRLVAKDGKGWVLGKALTRWLDTLWY